MASPSKATKDLEKRLKEPSTRARAIAELKNTASFPDRIRLTEENRSLIISDPFPPITKLKARPYVPYTTFITELEWITCLLSAFGSEILAFTKTREEFNQSILKGDLSRAEQCLQIIESKFGVSIWSIETRVALLQERDGLERQKEYVRDELDGADDLVKYFAAWFSTRAEKNLSFFRYQGQVSAALDSIGHQAICEYFRYQINYLGIPGYKNHFNPLTANSNSSLIDIFITFDRITKNILSRDPTNNEASEILRCIRVLRRRVDGSLFTNISTSCGQIELGGIGELERRLFDVIEFYTRGQYIDCIEAGSSLMSDAACLIEVYELVARSYARTGKSPPAPASLQGKILASLVEIYARSNKTHESILEIAKIAMTYSAQGWAIKLFGIAASETPEFLSDHSQRYRKLGALECYPANPRVINGIPDNKVRKDFRQTLRDRWPKSEAVKLTPDGRSNARFNRLDYSVPPERLDIYESRFLIDQGNFHAAERLLAPHTSSTDPVQRLDATRELLNAYLNSGQFSKIAQVLTSSFFTNESQVTGLPLESLTKQLERKSHIKEISSDISYVILLHIYTTQVSRDLLERLSDALEDFLHSLGVRRPSHLERHAHLIEKPKLVYLLRYICTPTTIDGWTEFSGTADQDGERIAICKLLSNIDPINAELYRSEIHSLTQKQFIDQGIALIDSSKIYVDVEGIRGNLSERQIESFDQYRDLSRLDPTLVLFDELVMQISKLLQTQVNISVEVPGSRLLRSMVEEVRDHFVQDNDFGLDGYLSMGIRHGTLSGQLRAPFEACHLITKKVSGTTYRPNEHWLDLYKHLPNPTTSALIGALDTFSKRVDDLIDNVKNQWIQIRRDKCPEGLFDYHISTNDLEKISEELQTAVSHDDFLDCTIKYLWRRTEDNLATIRRKIAEELKPSFRSLLDSLKADIAALQPSGSFHHIETKIGEARISAHHALDRVTAWFTITGPSFSADYELKSLIMLASQVIHGIHRETSFDIDTSSVLDQKFRGSTFRSLADVINILFENVVAYCGVDGRPIAVKVSLEYSGASNGDSRFTLKVRNEIGPEVSIEKVEESIAQVRRNLSSYRSGDKVKMEGGTGILKIRKIFAIDLACSDASIDLNVSASEGFTVSISFSGTELVAQ